MPELSVLVLGKADPPKDRVTFPPDAKPEPIIVVMSPAKPESGVSISVALPVVCCAPPTDEDGVVLVDVPFVEVALVFMPVVAPLKLLVALPVEAPVVLDVAFVAPVLDDVVDVGLLDVGDETAKVPSIISLKELVPSIEWSTFMPCTVMPLPLMVTVAVAPAAGDMSTELENPPSCVSRLLASRAFVCAEVAAPVAELPVLEVAPEVEPPEVEPPEVEPPEVEPPEVEPPEVEPPEVEPPVVPDDVPLEEPSELPLELLPVTV
jgi:hypothetical protein